MTRATLVAIALAAMAFGIAMLAHSAEQNDTEVVQVALDESDPERTRVGELVYMGGIDIPPMGENIGGLSALRWDAKRNKLVALTDDGRQVWMVVDLGPLLTDMTFFGVTPLIGLDGKPLAGKTLGDSESLTRSARGGWLVGFERSHRVWRYDDFAKRPSATGIDPVALLGKMEDNGGLEAMAGDERHMVMCAERQVRETQYNCVIRNRQTGDVTPLFASPSAEIAQLGGVPTDADIGSDGTIYILFRSWSRANGNGASIVAYGPDQTRRVLATLRPPLTVDNFEGLAIQEEGTEANKRTFLYIVSDDNFSSGQRTLLMKFEVLPDE